MPLNWSEARMEIKFKMRAQKDTCLYFNRQVSLIITGKLIFFMVFMKQ